MRKNVWKKVVVEVESRKVLGRAPREELQTERQFLEGRMVFDGFKNGNAHGAHPKQLSGLIRKSCAIQSDGDRTQKLHSEWSSVHDKIVHRKGIIKELQEQLEKDEIHEQEAREK